MKILMIISAVLFLSTAYGDHHEGKMGGGGGKCHKELKAMCDGKKGEAKWSCMKESVSKLSAECQKKMADHEGPCKADREKLCADVKPGGGRMIECMKNNMDKLSPACKEKWEHKKHMMEKHGKMMKGMNKDSETEKE